MCREARGHLRQWRVAVCYFYSARAANAIRVMIRLPIDPGADFYQRFASQRAYVSQFHEYMKLHTSARERGDWRNRRAPCGRMVGSMTRRLLRILFNAATVLALVLC